MPSTLVLRPKTRTQPNYLVSFFMKNMLFYHSLISVAIIEATLLLLWRHLNHYLQLHRTPYQQQQLYYQNYYHTTTLPKNTLADQTIPAPAGHILQDSDISHLREDSRNFLYSNRDPTSILNIVSDVAVVCTVTVLDE